MVHEGLGNRVEADFIDAGEQQVKNIVRPIRLFRWSPARLSKPKTQDQKSSERPSIAVLPFSNMSGDADQEYFSDGITEDIITELARFIRCSSSPEIRPFTTRGKPRKFRMSAAHSGSSMCRRQRTQIRQPGPDHSPAGGGGDRQSCVGRAL